MGTAVEYDSARVRLARCCPASLFMSWVSVLTLLQGLLLKRAEPNDFGIVGSFGVGDSGFNAEAADVRHDTRGCRFIGMEAREDGRPEW